MVDDFVVNTGFDIIKKHIKIIPISPRSTIVIYPKPDLIEFSIF